MPSHEGSLNFVARCKSYLFPYFLFLLSFFLDPSYCLMSRPDTEILSHHFIISFFHYSPIPDFLASLCHHSIISFVES